MPTDFTSPSLHTLLNTFLIQSYWEWLAACLGIIYVILAARVSIWCWPAAFISTFLYTLIFWQDQLPMQTLLNFYYMGMSIYGFTLWFQHRSTFPSLKITQRTIGFHLALITTGLLLTILIGGYLSSYTNTQFPYLDASITIFSMMNMILMAKKIIESWLYWIAIDLAAIVLFIQTGYYATVLMFSLYLISAIYGYSHWKSLKQHQTLCSK